MPKVLGYTSKTYCIENAMIYEQNKVLDIPLTFKLFNLFTFINCHILLVTLYMARLVFSRHLTKSPAQVSSGYLIHFEICYSTLKTKRQVFFYVP